MSEEWKGDSDGADCADCADGDGAVLFCSVLHHHITPHNMTTHDNA